MEGLIFGFEVLGLGFFVVLIALTLLAFILELFHRLLGEKESKKILRQPENIPSSHIDSISTAQVGKREVIAASIGAILCMVEGGGDGHFAIKEVKVLPTQRSNWALSGRKNILMARQEFAYMRRKKR